MNLGELIFISILTFVLRLQRAWSKHSQLFAEILGDFPDSLPSQAASGLTMVEHGGFIQVELLLNFPHVHLYFSRDRPARGGPAEGKR